MRKDEFPLIESYADSKVNEVLDKVRAEIEAKLAEPQYQHEGEDWQNGLIMAETIIDKYKGESETWNGIHAQITAPKGTFERIFNEADDDTDI